MASFNSRSESSFFTNLLVDDDDGRTYPILGRVLERTGSGQPKFKSAQAPPLLPISPSSSYFSMPELLDSPLLLSSSQILLSPTTGAFPVQAFGWTNNYSEFSLEPHPTNPSAMQEVFGLEVLREQNIVKSEYTPTPSISLEIVTNSTQNSIGLQAEDGDCQKPIESHRANKKVDDGYSWRKYGQKQLKKSENPRSYYKCTFPNCPTKKIVETSLEGQTTEIIYKGSHNHPKPERTRRSSASTSVSVVTSNSSHVFNPCCIGQTHDQSSATQSFSLVESVTTPENSSVSFDYGDLDHKYQNEKSVSETDEIDEEEPVAKRWRGEGEREGISSPGSRAVREPRVVVQTISDIDVLVDGYRWRKYGQKVVKGNHNPRSYYKCTYPGCGVRKHIERAACDVRAVITAYEGRHNHGVPTPVRGSHSLR